MMRTGLITVTALVAVVTLGVATPASAATPSAPATASGVPAPAGTAPVTTPATEAGRAAFDIYGGDTFFSGSARCTVGFAVAGGYVTAGRCGAVGSPTTGPGGQPQGTFAGSSYPAPGAAWVRVGPDWNPQGVVRTGDGTIPVQGGRPAPVGATACHYGSTTGWNCGTITARNATVTFPEGTITGLIRTNICSAPGDLGAPLISEGQAQGVLIGGSGACPVGVSYYVPIATIVNAYGLSLLTG